MKEAIYAGTFDPFTNGHDDILCRTLGIFDKVTVLVANSSIKQPLFALEDRVKMLERHLEGNSRIKIDHWEGLIVDYAKKHKINHLVRGLRPTGDFEFEFQMAAMNNALNRDLETVFLSTGEKHFFVSSSLIKEVIKYKRDISSFVPQAINEYINEIKQ